MTTDPDMDPAARAARRAEAQRQAKWRERRGWVGLGLAVLVGLVVLLQQFHISTVTACQTTYNSAFAASLVQRSALGDQDRAATQALIEGVFAPPASALKDDATRSAYTARLFASYERVETEIKVERKRHPYPQLPSRACR